MEVPSSITDKEIHNYLSLIVLVCSASVILTSQAI